MTHLDYLRSLLPSMSQPRHQALASFLATGFPTTRDEAWRYLDLAALRQQTFALPSSETASMPNGWQDLESQIVLFNGAPRPPTPGRTSLSEDLDSEVFSQRQSPFLTLNQALHTASVQIPLGGEAKHHASLQITHDSPVPLGLHTQDQVRVHSAAHTTLVTDFSGRGSSHCFVNHASHIQVGPHATLDHVLVYRGLPKDLTTHSLQVTLDEGSTYRQTLVLLSSQILRLDLRITLSGQGSHARSLALALPEQDQQIDIHSEIFHAASHTSSEQLAKSVVLGTGRFGFTGTVHIPKGVGAIEAHQLNRNLILSAQGKAFSRPRLQIDADDVKCSHGSSTGSLNDDELFYLRSRGYTKSEATLALVRAFGSEVLDNISHEALRNELDALLTGRVAG